MLDAEAPSDAARVLHIGEGTAGTRFGDARVLIVVKVQGNAGNVIPLLQQKACRDGAVYAAAHADKNFLFHLFSPQFFFTGQRRLAAALLLVSMIKAIAASVKPVRRVSRIQRKTPRVEKPRGAVFIS